ncbi:hypothetical protein KIN20_018977 [Parelaphostrongylus tenuis]|uniref:Uncharacterized protein n=1 Tax=Parelaphostrongylus tenuis TaxID=148309 RepID=A0AAD5QPZ1_PARTN|nr:hypothetical protein KIN20_018977 [Parelaphostrongylus tenuis]
MRWIGCCTRFTKFDDFTFATSYIDHCLFWLSHRYRFGSLPVYEYSLLFFILPSMAIMSREEDWKPDEELETMLRGSAVSVDKDTANESDASMDNNMHTS